MQHRTASYRTASSRRRPSRRAGFTLIEIMIVVLIIGVLLNIAAPAFVTARDRSQAKSCVKNLGNLMTAKEQYMMDAHIPQSSPTAVSWANVSPYIRTSASVPPTGPICPSTGATLVIGTPAVSPSCPYGGPANNPLATHSLGY